MLDDVDPEATAYLGLAKIPLISLAHGKNIKGTFHLIKVHRVTRNINDPWLQWNSVSTDRKNILKLVELQSLVAKCFEIRKI